VGGAVVITANLASESVTWRAYITKNGTDSYVFVPSWVGRKTAVPFTGHTDNWVEGYLYSAKPLQTMGNSSEHPTLDLNVPAETSPEHAQIDRQTRNVTMNIVKHVGNNWYLVTLAQ
jgi:hypothetical protein